MNTEDKYWKKNSEISLIYYLSGKPIVIQKIKDIIKIETNPDIHRVYGKDQAKVYYPFEWFILNKKRSVKRLPKFPKKSEKIIIKHFGDPVIIEKYGEAIKITVTKKYQIFTSYTFSQFHWIEKRKDDR